MEKYYFSPSNNQFLPESLIDVYKEANAWPEDAVEISNDIYLEFSAQEPPEGKIRGVGENNLPLWEDLPLPSKEELIAGADSKKQRLISDATNKMTPLQFAIDLDMATEEELELLKSYKKYIVLLSRIDTSQAPDITWPVLDK